MEILSQITTTDVVLAAICIAIGLAIGWAIWGGQAREIAQLEDSLTVMRAHARRDLQAPSSEPVSSGAVEKIWLADNPGDLSIDAFVDKAETVSKVGALEHEMDQLKAVYLDSLVDIDRLKEHLDESDFALKKANGQLSLLLRDLDSKCKR